jgi:hypothetical protein
LGNKNNRNYFRNFFKFNLLKNYKKILFGAKKTHLRQGTASQLERAKQVHQGRLVDQLGHSHPDAHPWPGAEREPTAGSGAGVHLPVRSPLVALVVVGLSFCLFLLPFIRRCSGSKVKPSN